MIPIIFNPAARSEQASKWEDFASELREADLRPTQYAGEARLIAQQLTRDRAPIIVAAGGDGTLNEVVQGIIDVAKEEKLPYGILPTKLGVLPVGTMNVLAHEHEINPGSHSTEGLKKCWEWILNQQNTKVIDLWSANEQIFLQLAGIGLDAEIIKNTTWEMKKQWGPFSYIFNAAKALTKPPQLFKVHFAERDPIDVSLVLLGNGQHYGGPFKVFPEADTQDESLDVVLFTHHGTAELLQFFAHVAFPDWGEDLEHLIRLKTQELWVEESGIPVEIDGELSHETPVRIQLCPWKLEILVSSDESK